MLIHPYFQMGNIADSTAIDTKELNLLEQG